MSPLWLLPLAVGAAGAVVLARANRKLAREVEALRRAWRPVPARSGPGRPGQPSSRPGDGAAGGGP